MILIKLLVNKLFLCVCVLILQMRSVGSTELPAVQVPHLGYRTFIMMNYCNISVVDKQPGVGYSSTAGNPRMYGSGLPRTAVYIRPPIDGAPLFHMDFECAEALPTSYCTDQWPSEISASTSIEGSLYAKTEGAEWRKDIGNRPGTRLHLSNVISMLPAKVKRLSYCMPGNNRVLTATAFFEESEGFSVNDMVDFVNSINFEDVDQCDYVEPGKLCLQFSM